MRKICAKVQYITYWHGTVLTLLINRVLIDNDTISQNHTINLANLHDHGIDQSKWSLLLTLVNTEELIFILPDSGFGRKGNIFI